VLELPYGRIPYPVDLARFGGRRIHVALPPPCPEAPPLTEMLDAALDAPIGRPRLETLVRPGDRITLIVSDATRDEPRGAFIAALRRRLPTARWTIAIATGTHGPARNLAALGVPEDLVVVNHDGETDLVSVGATMRGTPVRVHRCVVEADLVIATGCIRPHYFAGFGAGAKAIFPGLGGAREIRINHRLKQAPDARAGIVDENPCRADLEEAVRLVATPKYLLDGVCAATGAVCAAVAGDVEQAFRHGAELARGWAAVRVEPANVVIASDDLPVTASLYQAAKIAAACAHVVRPGGALVIVAECLEGIEPLETVNEAIFRIGVLPRLAVGATLFLLSSLLRSDVERTLVRFAPDLSDVVQRHDGAILLIPKASQLILDL
jgi:lactate racemase